MSYCGKLLCDIDILVLGYIMDGYLKAVFELYEFWLGGADLGGLVMFAFYR